MRRILQGAGSTDGLMQHAECRESRLPSQSQFTSIPVTLSILTLFSREWKVVREVPRVGVGAQATAEWTKCAALTLRKDFFFFNIDFIHELHLGRYYRH